MNKFQVLKMFSNFMKNISHQNSFSVAKGEAESWYNNLKTGLIFYH